MQKIFILKPYLSAKVWGGYKLAERFGKTASSAEQIIGESWEISTHADGESIIANGSYSDRSLAQLINDHPEVLGTYPSQLNYFPLLTKFIDAKEALSIQVHPQDDYAATYENDRGKNELWYIIDAEPGSFIYLGPKETLTKEEILSALDDGTFEQLLQPYPVQAGDSFYLPAGTIHSIGAGILLYEIQQSSNISYRLYDYNRPDQDGNLRELHIEKSLDVLDYEPVNQRYVALAKDRTPGNENIFHEKDFQVDLVNAEGARSLRVGEESFLALSIISGSAVVSRGLESYKLEAGQTIFVPAGTEELILSGNAKVITIRTENISQ